MAVRFKPIISPPLNSIEEHDAVALASYLLLLQRQGRIQLYSHIPNETYTKSWAVKRKNKLQGVRPGVPDYIIITPKTVLFLELKRKHGGVISPEQKEWIAAIEGKPASATVCRGFDQAKEYITMLLASEKNI